MLPSQLTSPVEDGKTITLGSLPHERKKPRSASVRSPPRLQEESLHWGDSTLCIRSGINHFTWRRARLSFSSLLNKREKHLFFKRLLLHKKIRLNAATDSTLTVGKSYLILDVMPFRGQEQKWEQPYLMVCVCRRRNKPVGNRPLLVYRHPHRRGCGAVMPVVCVGRLSAQGSLGYSDSRHAGRLQTPCSGPGAAPKP